MPLFGLKKYLKRMVPAEMFAFLWPVFARTRAVFLRRRVVRSGVYIAKSAQVLGWRNVSIGKGSVIGDSCFLNVNSRDNNNTAIDIGKKCFIGRRNFFSSGKLIKIGDYCITAPECRFLGSAHSYLDPFIPYQSAACTLDRSIEVGPNCFFGAGATILAGVKIGYGSVIAAGSIVTESIPPLCLVIGSPARVVKRFNLEAKTWDSVLSGDVDRRDLPTEEQYLAQLYSSDMNLGNTPFAADSALGEI